MHFGLVGVLDEGVAARFAVVIVDHVESLDAAVLLKLALQLTLRRLVVLKTNILIIFLAASTFCPKRYLLLYFSSLRYFPFHFEIKVLAVIFF